MVVWVAIAELATADNSTARSFTSDAAIVGESGGCVACALRCSLEGELCDSID